MICPHCTTNLLRKERGGRRCSTCRREFALEPKESPLGLHDIRIGKLAERLGDGRGLRYTSAQLWYAAARKKLPDVYQRFRGVRIGTSVAIVVLGFLAAVIGVLPPWVAIGAAIAASVLVNVGLQVAKPWFAARATVRMPVSYQTFRDEVIDRWTRVYRALPPGAVDESIIRSPVVDRPRFAVLCPDLGVLACLAANNVADGGAVTLCDRIDRLPPQVPVIVLHDASPAGIALAGQARATLGGRAVVAGLSPRAVLANQSAMRLRERRLTAAEIMPLRREPLSAAEIEWLADGWWSPLAAITPAKLLAAVRRAVERIEEAADPERRRAREVGFLTWPKG